MCNGSNIHGNSQDAPCFGTSSRPQASLRHETPAIPRSSNLRVREKEELGTSGASLHEVTRMPQDVARCR